MANRITIGKNESNSVNQFRINPQLQRTRASGSEQGIELGTKKPVYPTSQNNIVTLPNRRVPRNMNFKDKKKVPKTDQPSLQDVPKRTRK